MEKAERGRENWAGARKQEKNIRVPRKADQETENSSYICTAFTSWTRMTSAYLTSQGTRQYYPILQMR